MDYHIPWNYEEGEGETSYVYDDNNRLTYQNKEYGYCMSNEQKYSYDCSGNMTSKNTHIYYDDYSPDEHLHTEYENTTEYYGYNLQNKMESYDGKGQTSAYAYDGTGTRIGKTVNGVSTGQIWNNGNVIAEYGTKGTKTYIRGAGGEIVKTKDSASNNRYFSYNAHGDTTNIIEKNAESTSFAVTAAYEYDVFGGLVSGTGGEADSNAFRYNGQYTDEETGLIYLRNRYYDPSIGRFTQEDPAKDGINWYVYCENDPVNFVDPNGLDAIILTNSNAVDLGPLGTQGHTSAIYQDDNGNWFYTYWGDKAAAIIRIPDEYMNSLEDFNAGLSQFLTDNGFSNITSNYDCATYVVGDFLDSLRAEYRKIYNIKPIQGNAELHNLDDDSVIYQGDNGSYNVFTNNCLQSTIDSFGEGTLANDMLASDYMESCGYTWGIIPNNASEKFSEMFMNSSFIRQVAFARLLNYTILYMQGSPWAQVGVKANYASSVVAQ